MSLEVIQVAPSETYRWLLEAHYAKRLPSISYAFGLFDGRIPIGYVTYGTPAAAPLRDGVAGPENAGKVLELNRLVFPEPVENGPSMLVSRSLRLLPKPSIVVSFADIGQGHVGYVYQACNFLYTGLSAKRTDWKVKGMEHMHGQTVADMSRGAKGSRAQYMRDKFGDDFYLEERSRKHRYIYVCGSKSQRKRLFEQIRYPVMPYPKGETERYEIPSVHAQPQLFHIG